MTRPCVCLFPDLVQLPGFYQTENCPVWTPLPSFLMLTSCLHLSILHISEFTVCVFSELAKHCLTTVWLLLKKPTQTGLSKIGNLFQAWWVISEHKGMGLRIRSRNGNSSGIQATLSHSLSLESHRLSAQLFPECLTHSYLSASQFSCFLVYVITSTVSNSLVFNLSVMFNYSSTNLTY